MRYLVIALVFLGIVYLLERWKWNECRKVGHGVVYCLVDK